jgi:hypothetical protein
LRSRSISVRVGSETVRVASLEDILKSKRAAGRPKDLAVLPIRGTRSVKRTSEKRRKPAKRVAFERAARRMELEMIRERLARPPEERMDFLRVRLPAGGSTL